MGKRRMGMQLRGRPAGIVLGLATLALASQASASGIRSAVPDTSEPRTRATSASSGAAALAATDTSADGARRAPAIEVGATPLGARRPVAFDSNRAGRTGAVPSAAAYAYTFAASTLQEAEPRCDLRWSLLAAVGRLESDHGRLGASHYGDMGVVAPPVRGARLDGSGGTTKVRDTDAGDLDGDRRFDRAVGPMQLLPTTWSVVGVDADGNGKRNPDDIDDAALAAAVLLCGAPGRLSDDAGLTEALERYNATPGYAAVVTDLEEQYRRAGAPSLPSTSDVIPAVESTPSATFEALTVVPTAEQDTAGPQAGQNRPTSRGPGADGGNDEGKQDNDKGPDYDGPIDNGPVASDPEPAPEPDPTPEPEPTPEPDPAPDPEPQPAPAPAPEPDPTPEPQPAPDPQPAPVPAPEPQPAPVPTPEPQPTPVPEPGPELTELSGILSLIADVWYIGETAVLVGDNAWLSHSALADHDADSVAETNREELSGLLGVGVTAGIDSRAAVWTLRGRPYLSPVVTTPHPTPSAPSQQ